MTNELIIDAFEMTAVGREIEASLMLYSDQGIQYCSADYVSRFA